MIQLIAILLASSGTLLIIWGLVDPDARSTAIKQLIAILLASSGALLTMWGLAGITDATPSSIPELVDGLECLAIGIPMLILGIRIFSRGIKRLLQDLAPGGQQ